MTQQLSTCLECISATKHRNVHGAVVTQGQCLGLHLQPLPEFRPLPLWSLELSPDITSEQYLVQEGLCRREAPPLGPLESASLDSDVAMEGKWPRDLLPKAGWATSKGLQEGAVGQERLSRTDLCPAESTATVSDSPPLVRAPMWGT